MKKFLLLAILGLGLLLPTNTITAKGHFHKRIVNVGLVDNALLASSDKTDGAIQLIEIRQVPDGKLMASQTCNDYYGSVSTAELPSGYYVGKVYVCGKVYDKQFKK
jgi:hypothetical protein